MATIYILKSADGSFPECYVGKTTGLLTHRLAKHKYETKRRMGGTGALAPVSSAQLFEKGDVIIEALEEDVTLETLSDRERFHMENTPVCVNVRKSYSDPKGAMYAFNNSEHRKEYMKKYADEHKDAVALSKKKYKRKQQEEKVLCEVCEVLVSKRTMKESHIKSKRHVDQVQRTLIENAPGL
jgi:hypothetical protein